MGGWNEHSAQQPATQLCILMVSSFIHRHDFFVWSFVVSFLSCVLGCCGVVLVLSCVVLFVLCVCVCDLFLLLQTR